MNILLVEPSYRSTFPPLGLLRISSYFKSIGVTPTFVRGTKPEFQRQHWDKVYVSSLFTFELPRTVKTVEYYSRSVNNPATDIIVGGVGATLMPQYLEATCNCKVVTGPLCNPNMLGLGEPPIADYTPDYDILSTVDKKYTPSDAYFARVTIGCIRKCAFCAVPVLEPQFGYLENLEQQISAVNEKFGPRHDLVILDNNIFAIKNIDDVLNEIKRLGFEKGATLNGRNRYVDFNQGIDIRLITPSIAKILGQLAVYPLRIAFDSISIENAFRKGVELLANEGITYFMTYVMFNFKDTPEDFYRRLQINLELSEKFKIRITGFPMRFCPIDDIDRHHISENWNWRYLRGIQCILNATHGVVSPNPKFFNLSFGDSVDKFKEIISMPDDYIIYRSKNEENAKIWRSIFIDLSDTEKIELYSSLENLKKNPNLTTHPNEKICSLLRHY